MPLTIRRRELIVTLGGTVAAWPLAARAQQMAMPVIGFLHLTSLETNREKLAAFRRGLGDTGYIEDKNVAIEYRWAQGRNDRLPTLAAELVRRQVSVIVVLESTNGALAAKAATQTIPVIFMQGADPVQIGLVDSLNRPGGNLTGIGLLSAETAGKRLQLLLELVPKATSIGYLRNPTNPVYAETETREVQIAAHAQGVRLMIVNASRPSEIETAFADLVQQRADALQVSSDGYFFSQSDQIVTLSRHAVPAIYPRSQFMAVGGLMSYGSNIVDGWRQAGIYAGRICRLTGAAEHKNRAGHQSQDCEGARPHFSNHSARPRRRGYRIRIAICCNAYVAYWHLASVRRIAASPWRLGQTGH
jgi:putative ABC transport system substrate-binding protein